MQDAASPKTGWYFAYGSNMQAATFRGRRSLEPLAVRTGRLAGYELCFDIPIGAGERGVANLVARPEGCVWGVLYLLDEEQHARLDRSEGVPNGLYRRVSVEVDCDGDTVVAETLVSELRDPSRRPSHRYHSLLVEGAREHGLPEEWLATLAALSLAFDEREGAFNPPENRKARCA